MSLPVLADRETGELVEDPTSYMAIVLHRAKSWLEEAQSIDDVRDARAMAVGYEAVIREKELGFDAQLAATEIVRRCERRIGELKTFTAVNAGQGKARMEEIAMSSATVGDFDAAVDEARDEGNLSRANVVRKIRGDATPADPDPLDDAGDAAMALALNVFDELCELPFHIDALIAKWDDLREDHLQAGERWSVPLMSASNAINRLLERTHEVTPMRRVK